MKIGLSALNETPIFTVEDPTSTGSRVFGGTLDRSKTHWRFPAFPPFVERVLHDLGKVYKPLTFSAEAEAWIGMLKTEEEWIEYASNVKLPGPFQNYEHQAVGLGKILHNYRYILQWEMGTGKTKPIIDMTYLLKEKVLVLCPLVAAKNWAKEVRKHTGDALTPLAMLGSRGKKLRILNEHDTSDVFIATYDTARLHGVPSIAPKVLKYLLSERGYYPTDALKRALTHLNDGAIQMRLAKDWVKGRTTRDIGKEARELAKGSLQWITQLGCKVIVADESHRIKHIKSQRTKVCMRLAAKFPRRYLLSGTLSLGDPRDLYPQLKFLAPYTIPYDYEKFCDKYVVYSQWNKHVVVGYKKLDTLNKVVTGISDRKELDECVDLPERTTETLYFDLTKAQLNDYNQAVEQMVIDRPNAEPLELQNGAIRLNKLLQICSGFFYSPTGSESVCDGCSNLRKCVAHGIHPGSPLCILDETESTRETLRYSVNPKLDVLDEFLDDLLANPTSKVIIWANFTAELDDLEGLIKKKKLGYVRVDGTNSHKMSDMEDIFQQDPQCRVFLGQIKTGIAVTLTAAKYTVYYSRSWSLEDWLQSRNRNYRIGQTEKTVIYHLCARRTVETQQITALKVKRDISSTLTKNINCMVCANYAQCVKDNIEPWADGCILSRQIKKKITKVGVVHLGEATEES
jgi:SNF2 family DNA or RNA helicase